MCGRFAVLTYEEVAAVAKAVEQRLAPPVLGLTGDARMHALPGDAVPFLAPQPNGTLSMEEAVWGFQTNWSQSLVFNTRVESALEGSPLWREAIRAGRCIVPVASFFEPHVTERVTSPRTGRPMKRPYEFADPSGTPLLLAGLHADGRCSIVTCEPNEWVAPIHKRMPLVMRFQEARTWLSPDWPRLVDRANVELSVRPEALQPHDRSGSNDQLTLF